MLSNGTAFQQHSNFKLQLPCSWNAASVATPLKNNFKCNLLNYERDIAESIDENIDSVNTPLSKLRFHRVLALWHRWHWCWCRRLRGCGLARCQRLQDLSSASSSSSSSNRRRESSLSSVGVCWEIWELYGVFAYIL